MIKIFIISILATLLFYGECNDDDQKDINKFLDNILEKARKELPDPIRLPPRSTFVELTDGVFWGLSNITRLGDAEVTREGNIITIKGKITTDEAKARYTWTKKRILKNRGGTAVFISQDFLVELEVVIEKIKGQVTHARLEQFEIEKFKDVKIEFTGRKYLTWALGELMTRFSIVFQRSIAQAVQDPLKEVLERVMKEIEIKE